MNAGDLCNRDVVTIEGGAGIIDAARLMREHHVGDLVVVEERPRGAVPVGILTDRDIVVGLIAPDVPELPALRVSDVVADELVVAREDESLADVVKRMRTHGIRRIPVVDDEGVLLGIIAFDDVVDLLASMMDDLAALVGREVSLERELRE